MLFILQKCREYFRIYDIALLGSSLSREARKKKLFKELWTIANYVFVCLGVMCQKIFEYMEKGVGFSVDYNFILFGVVVSAVILPSVYKNSGIARAQPSVIHLFLSFQQGFFWQTILETLKSTS